MLINAELLLQFQRCKRRAFLDTRGDRSQRDGVNDLLLKIQQDKIAHQKRVLAEFSYQQPSYRRGDLQAGQAATIELMQQGVKCIHQGVLLTTSEGYTLLSRPDLLVKQPGNSCFGDWIYVPATIEMGKRPKQEYQVIATYHAYVLSQIQQVNSNAWILLRGKEAGYFVDVPKWTPLMERTVSECIQSLEAPVAPEVFISRQRCSLCHWYNSCYAIAQSQRHLSLLPGVTPIRYAQLQSVNINTLESLAQANPQKLENLSSFDEKVAYKLVLQAQSILENRPIALSYGLNQDSIFNSPVELYFDIEAQPDLHLDYLLGVLVVDKQNNTEKFYSFTAEKPEDEEYIWQQFLGLVSQYPEAPIYHFCIYEFDTVKRLAKLYGTPYTTVESVLNRFVDVYEELIHSVALPIESYALKAIARWLGFEWRDKEASGAQCIYWYDKWLKTGDRALLEVIQRYNEDDCYATRSVKEWLVKFLQTFSTSLDRGSES
jgi:uncharacterized protein